jgi:2-C-methyl-D-erythritol 4-phosphate cytidylyltransferase
VRRGLRTLPPEVDVVLVHDAARAFMPAAVISAVAAAVAHADAVVPVVDVVDTVKQVDADGVVVKTVDRSALRAAQTPQGFRRHVLEAAHAAAPERDATDDAALAEAAGYRVVTVPGSPYGMKVTTSFDLAVIQTLLQERVSP